MLLKVLVGLAVLLLVFAVVVLLRPSDFSITRSGTINAPPSAVFPQVNDFHNWEKWSPWAQIDPGMKQTYEGASSGQGAIYTWTGNSQVGQGRMTISESRSNERIRIHLEFMKPFAGICPTEFTFTTQGNQTVVNWNMTGRHTFIPKAIGLFMSMDKMIGGQFETGLAQMKAVVESAAPVASAAK
jgi:hypothetical protein